MSIVRNVKDIGVDAGMIIVMDMDYLKSVKHSMEDLERLGKVIKVPVGEYFVSWAIPETWHGDIEGDGIMKVTSGEVIIIDPCYVIGKPEHNDWIEWLDENGYGDEIGDDRAFVISSMGGDGVYDVQLEFTKTKPI